VITTERELRSNRASTRPRGHQSHYGPLSTVTTPRDFGRRTTTTHTYGRGCLDPNPYKPKKQKPRLLKPKKTLNQARIFRQGPIILDPRIAALDASRGKSLCSSVLRHVCIPPANFDGDDEQRRQRGPEAAQGRRRRRRWGAACVLRFGTLVFQKDGRHGISRRRRRRRRPQQNAGCHRVGHARSLGSLLRGSDPRPRRHDSAVARPLSYTDR